MFRATLFAIWKWSWFVLIPLGIIAFAMPMYSVRKFGEAGDRWTIAMTLGELQMWGVGYALVSMLVGLLVASAAWSYDHRGKFVYALTLPLPRWHLALLRFGSGVVMLAIPAVFLWIGSLAASATTVLPAGLRAYPGALALRFALASFVAYAISFALTAAPTRYTIALFTILGGIVLLETAAASIGMDLGIIPAMIEAVVEWPGFLDVYAGRWMLVDA